MTLKRSEWMPPSGALHRPVPRLATEELQRLELVLGTTDLKGDWVTSMEGNIYSSGGTHIASVAGDLPMAKAITAMYYSAPALLDEVKAARKLARRLRQFIRSEVEGTPLGKSGTIHELIVALQEYEGGRK